MLHGLQVRGPMCTSVHGKTQHQKGSMVLGNPLRNSPFLCYELCDIIIILKRLVSSGLPRSRVSVCEVFLNIKNTIVLVCMYLPLKMFHSVVSKKSRRSLLRKKHLRSSSSGMLNGEDGIN